jgi:uncharacterized SAM-binding protein YcdF (DUF218 family)
MVFFLRKLIEALLLPLGISVFLMVLGIFLRRRWISFAGTATLIVFSMPITGGLILRPLERSYELKTVASAPVADAIVVLSGGVVRGIAPPGVQWGETANRYFTGFDLAMAGKAKFIVFTGAETGNPGPSQGAIMRQVAIHNGFPAERIVVTPNVLTTEDEALKVSQIPGVHSILLVTSALHMPRAVLLFRANGFDVSPFPTDIHTSALPRLTLLAFVPGSLALQRSEEALREYYGLAVYRLLLGLHPLGRLNV